MITASAVKLEDGRVFIGKRHGDCYLQIKELVGDKSVTKGSTQGFINDNLKFLDREQAYYEAYDEGQCELKEYVLTAYAEGLQIEERNWRPLLASEDLW